MKVKTTVGIIFLAVTMLLCSCGEKVPVEEVNEQSTEGRMLTKQEGAPGSDEDFPDIVPETGEETDSAEKEVSFEPSAEELGRICQTWDCVMEEGGKETVYRLILGDENMAQLVVQNGIGELQALSFGTFALTDENHLLMDFEKDMENGKVLEGSERTHFGGTYRIEMENSYCLNMTGEKGAASLAPGSEKNETLVFYDTRYTPDKLQEVSDAVLHYYEAQTGHEYTGKALIDEISEEGILIHLCEDMGDHIATSGWYLIDPFTFQGTDEIMGTEIDFAPYS